LAPDLLALFVQYIGMSSDDRKNHSSCQSINPANFPNHTRLLKEIQGFLTFQYLGFIAVIQGIDGFQ
jgi:hypothetical protein